MRLPAIRTTSLCRPAPAARPVVVLGLLLMLPGCAINGRGLLARRCYFQNDTTQAVQIDARGISLITAPFDSGITIGRSRKTYYWPRPTAQAGPATRPAPPSDLPVPLRQADPFSWGGRRPLAIASYSEGVALDASQSRVGLTIGVRSSAILRVHNTFDGSFAIAGPIHDPAGCRFFFKEERAP